MDGSDISGKRGEGNTKPDWAACVGTRQVVVSFNAGNEAFGTAIIGHDEAHSTVQDSSLSISATNHLEV